ncbi:MAG: hypothetical protein PHG14_11120 [Desulfobacter postgatei]|uniref:Uncharacterized protein n=1 Tax=Desulfobacter postgatei 2ac9 TaxID=879212 RepID=I5B7M3_9BACT|nr:hypothetical protein [Desulfobacter postgatei]EIM65486.1 hypothetical protein DespoDRAFT_03751 [Desulfobacter postgatei 2ac9]MDD4274264.1 hypothetical protein [Desulfobacter postgatei]
MKRTKQTTPTPDNPTKPKDRVQPGTFLDAKIYQKAKIQAMTEGITTGELIDRAILLYLDHINKEAQP